MVVYDLYCPECEAEVIDAFIDTSKELPNCEKCGTQMKKCIVPVRFKLVYNNRTDTCDWDGNSTQYWKAIREKGGEEPVNDKQTKWE